MTKITLVNHASVLIENEGFGLLSDPWYFGEAFNSTWRLLEENTEEEIDNILDRVNVIWISHEHPDHFSVPFFKKYRTRLLRDNVSVLFQETEDRRVANFLGSIGIRVNELKHGKEVGLNRNTSIRLLRFGLIDSALLVDCSGLKILNLNDCTLRSGYELKRLRKQIGDIDILLSQFGNASWKPKSDVSYTEMIKWQKASTLRKQVEWLKPKILIPFASFSYWCTRESYYLNKLKCTTAEIHSTVRDKTDCRVLARMETLDLALSKKSSGSAYWDQLIVSEKMMIKSKITDAVDLIDIEESVKSMTKEVFKMNNRFILRLLRLFGLACAPFFVRITETQEVVAIDPYKGLLTKRDPLNDVDMVVSSNVLQMLFRSPFGLDTLIVSGEFLPGRKGGLGRVIRSMWLRSINCYGYKLDLNPFAIMRLRACVSLMWAIAISKTEAWVTRRGWQ